MKLLDLTLPTPADNLACDEALLDLCEETGVEVLRFWESPQHFVVVGYGNRIEREVNAAECRVRGIPILRRCSGGGTVIQGPGCLNYNLTLRIPESGPLTTVTETNEFVMQRNRAALEKLLGDRVAVHGHTDLAIRPRNPNPNLNPNRNPPPSANSLEGRIKIKSGITIKSEEEEQWLKFSGNAQRRRRNALVFHGTILHAFDLELMNALLPLPSVQPQYRASRPHGDFVRNLSAEPNAVRDALREAWGAEETLSDLPSDHMQRLLREHYLNEDWIGRPSD